jgi:hypothetical protein
MSYVRTGSRFYGMGTVGGAASAGASAGGSSGSSSAGMSTATSVIGAASSITGSIVSAYYDIMGMRSERESLATGSNIAASQLLEEARYSQQSRQMAAEEAAAQNAVNSATGAAIRGQENAIALETARLRGEQARQEIESRIGGSFGRSRVLPSWAWWGIGIGGVGLTLLTVWLVSRRG